MMIVHNTANPASMTKGVTSKKRKDKFKDADKDNETVKKEEVDEVVNDPLMYNKSVSVSFLKFLMLFYIGIIKWTNFLEKSDKSTTDCYSVVIDDI